MKAGSTDPARAWSEIEKLNWHLTEFAQESTTALMHRSQSLRLLRTIDWSKESSTALTSRPEPVPPSAREPDRP